MINQYKPAGYNSVSPYIMVDGARKFIDMLIQIFEAKEKRSYVRTDGSVMHAELQIDDSVIMIADATEKYPAYHFWLHIYVLDVDKIFEKAVEYGCEVIESPTMKEGDTDRRGTLRDFTGNFWAVGTQIEEDKNVS